MFCCEALSVLVSEGEIGRWGTPDGFSFHIHGRPSFADDGDGYYDDMTENYQIFYCPFCGNKLAAQHAVTADAGAASVSDKSEGSDAPRG